MGTRVTEHPVLEPLSLAEAARQNSSAVLEQLASSRSGLTSAEAERRLRQFGPNAIRSHGARPLAVLLRQLQQPLLILLVASALTSLFDGQRTDAVIILLIVLLSVGPGFANEFRAEQAAGALHSRIRHTAVTLRDGRAAAVDVTQAVLARCRNVGPDAQAVLDVQFDAGSRVVAVATRDGTGLTAVTSEDERELSLAGFLIFIDRPKADAAASLRRLAGLGIEVKIITGDNARVAQKVCADLGLRVACALTGAEIGEMTDPELQERIAGTTIFARVTPEQKSRIIRLQRERGTDVAFLGDGVNDAVALHDADVGISVDSATDVAKDAADIVLLKKDLGVLADGVVEGRRIFSNTIKYVLMGTSSNFGNMFSAAGASLFLSFLPMLPTQILVNNLLYDVSEMTIPTDNVDEELLQRPAHWDAAFIRRFMAFFGPISSIYDFLTFGVMIWVFHAGEKLFHSGWFVESLATQSLVIFVIRTRRIPFVRSRPSTPLLVTTLVCASVGVVLPFTPLSHAFGFTPLPATFLAILVAMIATYLALVELGKARFFGREEQRRTASPLARPRSQRVRRVHRLAARWSHPALLTGNRARCRKAVDYSSA